MKLLFLVPHKIWPLTSGNRLRNYHLARQLATHASVTLVEMCYAGEPTSTPPDDSGFSYVIRLNKSVGYTAGKFIRGIVGPTPVTLLNYFEPRLASQLATIFERGQFNAVHLGGFHVSPYFSVAEAASARPAILVDWHNIESELMKRYSEAARSWPRRLVAQRTATLLERSELRMLERCRMHTVASERERDKLLSHNSSATVRVIPNAVDLRYFSGTAIPHAPTVMPSPSNRNLLFVGSMDYHANIDAVIWFAQDVWPVIAHKYPDLKFVIVGRDPALEVRNLQSDRIRVTGTVEDVRPYYAAAQAVIVPLRVGSGTRLKILEAMAAGVPIVSTRLGAEGIDVTHDVQLLLADNGSELISAIDALFSSRELRDRLTRAARDRVKSTYDWSVVGKELFSIYVDLLSTSR
jgi:sugar transferase (PEP-CTERM/EpsH1 system associated)